MIPKYCATCDECIDCYYGTGETPDESFRHFMNSGDFESYCNQEFQQSPQQVDVFIYSVIDIFQSDWPKNDYSGDEECEGIWTWRLDEKIETRQVTYVG